MDSRVVNLQIKRRIWPRLRDAGFTTFSSRTAWRHHRERIDVVNFQSFNSYNAEVIGCTTYSFQVNLGCFYLPILPQYEPSRTKMKGDLLVPQEYDCHFRGGLSRSFNQSELKERRIWYIDPGEKYLGWALTDVDGQIPSNVLRWFDSFSDPEYVLCVLQGSDEEMGKLWGFGRNPSPVRHYFIGYVALAERKMQLAKNHLSLALASGCFKQIERRLASDIQKADHALQVTSSFRGHPLV